MPDTDNPPYTLAPHKDVAMDQVVAKNEATVVVCCCNFEQTRCMNAPPLAFSIFNLPPSLPRCFTDAIVMVSSAPLISS